MTVSPRADQRGIVYIEMLMALVPVLVTFLGICQLALLYAGQLVVQHAATRAVRAAVVVLDDDPKHYDEAPRGNLLQGKANTESQIDLPKGDDRPNQARLSKDLTSSTRSSSQDKGARWGDIAKAAYHPLSVLAPPLTFNQPTLKEAVAQGAGWRLLVGRLFYVQGATALSLHGSGNDEEQTEFSYDESVTARIHFLMPCNVPVASSLICTSRLSRLASRLGFGSDRSDELIEKTENVESKWAREVILLAVPHLELLTAEATMPNQGARYYKESE